MVGFEVDERRASHFATLGLRAIEQRIESIDGMLDYQHQGTNKIACLQYPDNQDRSIPSASQAQ
jgi:hypothetical protein